MGRRHLRKINQRLRRPLQNEIEGMEPVIEQRVIDGQLINVKIYPYAIDWLKERAKQSGDDDDNG